MATFINPYFEGKYIEPTFQPIADRDGNVCRVEMLARVANNKGLEESTQAFINNRESRGTKAMFDFDSFMLQYAHRTLVEFPKLHLNMNISALTLSNPEWESRVVDTFKRRPEIARRMGYEITETQPITNVEQADKFCVTARSMGSQIVFDDCGAGHFQSIAEAARILKPNAIKIAAHVVQGTIDNEGHVALFKSFQNTARELSISVVAEGVDERWGSLTTRQAHKDTVLLKVLELGADYLQGHRVGKPSKKLSVGEPKRRTFAAELQQTQPMARPA